MKTTKRPRKATRILAASIAALLAGHSAQAAIGLWTGGSGGTWDTTNTNWSGVTSPAWGLTNGPVNTALFNTAGAVAAIGDNVYVGKITFATAATVTGSVFNSIRYSAGSGKTITLEQNDTAATATISAGIGISAATGNSTGNTLAKTGTGKLTLSGTNFLTGTVDGGNFTGQLKVDGGGELNLTGSLYVTYTTGSSNRTSAVSVIGGTTGNNTLSVTGAGPLVTGNVTLGNGTNGNTITVSPSVAGTASAPTWTLYGNSAQLNWNGSNNAVNLGNGAYVAQVIGGGSPGWNIGNNAGNTGNSLLVDGAGTTVSHSNSGFIVVGNAGSNNTFTVQNGGTVLGGRVLVGATGSANTQLITGAGSILTANLAHNGNFEIGQGAGASGNAFRVEAGGVVKLSGNTADRQFSVGETATSNNNYVSVSGAGSQLHLIQSALPLVIGGSQASGGTTINSGGAGNHIDVGSGGWLNLDNSAGAVPGVTVTGGMAMVLTGTGSAFNLGDGTGISTANVGATGAITGVSLRSADSRLNFNSGRLVAGVNGALVSGPGQIQLGGPAYLSTAFAGSTITSAIGGPGSLIKEDAGTLTLSGANSYTGDTTVSLGTLSITNPYLADGSAVHLTTGGLLNLNTAAAIDTISAFYIDGVAQPAGTWGALGSGAVNQTSLITGSGALFISTHSIPGIIWTGGVGGTWNTTNANWSGVGNPAWDSVNGPGRTAVFDTPGAVVAISGGVYMGKITFATAATVTGSVFNSIRYSAGSGKTITLEQNDTAATATISAGIGISAATGNSTGNTLAKTGTGKLTLSGTNFLTGTVDGGNFTGQLKVDGGGELNLTGSLYVTYTTGSSNRTSAVSVIGGTTGNNTLSVTGAGPLVTGNVTLGNGTNGNTITVSPSVAGTASAPTWTLYGNSAQLNWNGSNNAVNLGNGAYVAQVIGGGSPGWNIGNNAGNTGNSLLVDGAGTTVSHSNSGFIVVGNAGSNNTFTVQNGGTVLGGRVLVGATGSANTQLITGAGSILTANLAHNGNFEIGQGAGASGNAFRVEAGGVVKLSGNTADRQFSVGETATSNNNYVSVSGAGSQLHLIQSALPLVIGGSQASGGTTINSGGAGNHIDVGSGGWLNLDNSAGAVPGVTVTGGMAMVLTGTGSAFNLGDGTGISTANVGATGAITGVSLRSADSRLNFNSGRLVAGVNGALVSGPGQIQLGGPAYLSTAFAGSTITSAIGGPGSLIKEDAGTLTLSGANSYTGDTTVSLGTLSITNPYLADGADIYLVTGALFDLNTAAIDTIKSFYIDGVEQAAGIWGAIGSGAANETSLITGSGSLDVNPSALAWLTTQPTWNGPGSIIPEPSTALLLGLSSSLIASMRRRRR